MKDIDAAYYGFRDDDDGLLVPLEVEAEKAAIGQFIFLTIDGAGVAAVFVLDKELQNQDI